MYFNIDMYVHVCTYHYSWNFLWLWHASYMHHGCSISSETN